MIRWKKYFIIAVLIITLIGALVIWLLEIRPHLINERIKEEVRYETKLLEEKFKIEFERITELAASSHPQCRTTALLISNSIPFRYGQKIPAYPHLSDIYLYVVPPLKQDGSKRIPGKKYAYGHQYKPLTLEDVESLWASRKRKHPDYKPAYSPSEFYGFLQKDVLTTVLADILQKTLAYCTADVDGVPKKVKIVDTPRHENLEQEDALTIVAGAVYHTEYEGIDPPLLSYQVIQLKTSQYIPRWQIFPSKFHKAGTYAKRVKGFAELDADPYNFASISVGNFIEIPTPDTDPMRYYTNFSGGYYKRNLWVQYKSIEDETVKAE